MVRAGFARNQARRGMHGVAFARVGGQLREQLGLLGRGDVQHVEAMLVPAGQVDRAPRAEDRCFMIANVRMIGHFVCACVTLDVGPHAALIFAVGADRQRRLCEDPLERLLVIDKQVARTRTDKNLDAWRPLDAGQLCHVGTSGRDVENVVDQTLFGGEGQLCVEACLRGGGGPGVGHLEEGRDATLRAGAAGGGQVFLVREARLAEMHVGIDDAGQQMQTGRRRSPRRLQVAQPGRSPRSYRPRSSHPRRRGRRAA